MLISHFSQCRWVCWFPIHSCSSTTYSRTAALRISVAWNFYGLIFIPVTQWHQPWLGLIVSSSTHGFLTCRNRKAIDPGNLTLVPEYFRQPNWLIVNISYKTFHSMLSAFNLILESLWRRCILQTYRTCFVYNIRHIITVYYQLDSWYCFMLIFKFSTCFLLLCISCCWNMSVHLCWKSWYDCIAVSSDRYIWVASHHKMTALLCCGFHINVFIFIRNVVRKWSMLLIASHVLHVMQVKVAVK